MPTAVFFGSRRINVPGSYTVLDASALAGLSPAATGIVALLGTSEGGKPLTAESADVDSTTSDGVRKKFRGGDLRVAGQFAFAPSGEDAVGGAQRVVAVKVNPAVQSSARLFDTEGSPAVEAVSKDYGAHTEGVSVDVETGTLNGKRVVVDLESVTESIDNLGGSEIFIAEVPATTPWPDALGSVSARAFDAKVIGGAAAFHVPLVATAPTLVSTQAGDTMNATVYGIDNAGAVSSTTVALNGTTPVPLGVTLRNVTGVTFATPPAGTVTVTHDGVIVASVAGRRTASGFTPVRSATLDGRSIYVWATHSYSTPPTGKVVLRGVDTTNASITEIVTLNGGNPVQLSGLWRRIDSIETGNVLNTQRVFVAALAPTTSYLIDDAVSVTSPSPTTAAGAFVKTATTVSVVSSNALDTAIDVTIYGLDASFAQVSAVVALNGTTPVLSVATFAVITGVTLASACVGTVTLTYGGGVSGASALPIPPATTSYGTAEYTIGTRKPVPAGQSVFVEADTDQTADADRYVVVVGLDASNAAVSAVTRLAGRTRLVLSPAFAFITAIRYLAAPGCAVHVGTQRTALPATECPKVSQLIERIAREPGAAVTTVAPDTAGILLTDLDQVAPAIISDIDGAPFYADLYRVIQGVNQGSEQLQLTRHALATRTLGNIADPVYLNGGGEGTTTITEWQEALRVLKKRRVNQVVPLTRDPAVHALTRAHLIERAGKLRSEANGYIGLGTAGGAGETRANIKTQILNLNTRHLSALAQEIQKIDPDTGEATWYPPHMFAVLAAGMQAGTAVGEPLTKKRPDVLDIRNDSSWSVEDDAEDMIDAGLMFAEKRDGEGTKFVRSITTYLTDDNVVFSEMSANAAANHAVYELRRRLETKVGQRGISGSAAAIKGLAQQVCEELLGENVIVAFKSITVEQVGDVFSVSVEMAPVLPINFVLTTVHLVAVRIAA